MDFTGAEDGGCGHDNSSQIVTANQPTDTRPFTGRMPFLSFKQQCQSTEGKYHIPRIFSPHAHLAIFQLCL